MNRKKINGHGILEPLYEKYGVEYVDKMEITVQDTVVTADEFVFNEPWSALTIFIEMREGKNNFYRGFHFGVHSKVRVAFAESYTSMGLSYRPIHHAVKTLDLSYLTRPIHEDHHFTYTSQQEAHYCKNIMLEFYTAILLDKPGKIPDVKTMEKYGQVMDTQNTAQKLADL